MRSLPLAGNCRLLLFLSFFCVCATVAPAQSQQSIDARPRVGTQELMRGDCADAQTDLRAALAARPSLIQAEGLLGVCEKRLGEPQAQVHLEHAFARLTDPIPETMAPARTSSRRANSASVGSTSSPGSSRSIQWLPSRRACIVRGMHRLGMAVVG